MSPAQSVSHDRGNGAHGLVTAGNGRETWRAWPGRLAPTDGHLRWPHLGMYGASGLWCNARTPAAAFYRWLGFAPVGDECVGPHRVIVRQVRWRLPSAASRQAVSIAHFFWTVFATLFPCINAVGLACPFRMDSRSSWVTGLW